MTKTPPPAPASPSGLSTQADIEALADQIRTIADEIHARVVKSVDAHQGKPVPQAEQAAARALIDHELELRQRASGLYAEAAGLVVKSLGKSQAHVLAQTAAAAEKIRKIGHLGHVIGVVAGVLTLAAAASSGQPVTILAALEKLRTSIKGVKDTSPPSPA